MKKRYLLLAALSLLVGWGSVGVAQAEPTITFEAGDRPGNFFTCSNTANSASIGCVPAGIGGAQQRSLAVIAPGETVGFSSVGGEASTIHTALSLIWPKGATHDDGVEFSDAHPYKTAIDFRHPAPGGVATVKLDTPGLYVFICDIHVYMFAGVIVDDPNTTVNGGLGLDLGEQIHLVPGIEVPTYSDLAVRLLRTFFILTDPGNWKDYNQTSWTLHVPPVPVILYDVNKNPINIADLNAAIGLTTALPTPTPPAIPAVGEIWVDTQFELTAGKAKPGMATAIRGSDWSLQKKVALPEINMNHPHNMWTDQTQSVIYQTMWFDERLAVFNRTDGSFIRQMDAGPAPSHVMTRANNDLVHVAQNGGNYVREFDTLKNNNVFIVDLPMGPENPTITDVFHDTHPHGHWMSADGSTMVTPNENLDTSTVYSFPAGAILASPKVGAAPIATGMMPDASKYYVTNVLSQDISVIDMTSNTVTKTINLLEKYDPIGGCNPLDADHDCSVFSLLPIQSPVSPDGTNMITAHAATANITVVDTRPGLPTTDTVVKVLPCEPGCHGVQYGAKDLTGLDPATNGRYYAYVASKYSNVLTVVDPDPNGDGDPSDAMIAGHILLDGKASAVQDDTVLGNRGMGGQGVLPVPNVYNGWVQQWVQNCNTKDCKAWKGQLTAEQKNPGQVPNQNPGQGHRNH